MQHFYPRPPRGGRPRVLCSGVAIHAVFLSTPSARRATILVPLFLARNEISIHALREEGDMVQMALMGNL